MDKINGSVHSPQTIRYERSNPIDRQKQVQQEKNSQVNVQQNNQPPKNDTQFPLGSQIDTKA